MIVILDSIRSAHNVGAILRTCDGAGVEALYLCGITPKADHPKVVKTALGAEKYVKTFYFKDIIEAINEVKSQGYTIISVEQNPKAENFNKINLSEKVCFIFGNEITGVSTDAISISDKIVDVPMFGKKNSLNVATTVGIIVYSAKLNE